MTATGWAGAGAVLYAKDIARVARFYTSLAGLTPVYVEDDHVVMETPQFQLIVLAIPEPLASQLAITTPPQRRGDTPIKLVFAVNDLAAVRAAAPGLGGILNPAAKEWAFDGTVVCDGHDPEGNVVQFRQPAV